MYFESSTNTISVIDLINLSKDVAQLNLGYLAIAVTILGILGVVFVYFNINPLKDALNRQEDKVDALKKEADKILKSSEENVQVSLNNFREEQKQVTSEFLNQSEAKNILETKNQVALVEKVLLEKIESVSEGKDVKLKEIILSETVNKISATEKSVGIENNKIRVDLNEKITSLNGKITTLEKEIFEIRRSLVEFEIENHLKKRQVGAMRKMIEKLEMDIKRTWGADDTLVEIKQYILEHGMPNYYFTDLQNVLEKLTPEFKLLKDEILKLAQEKIYKVKD